MVKKRQKNQLRKEEVGQLEETLAQKQKDLAGLQVEKKADRKKDVHLLGKSRQEVAVIKTIIREKKLEEEVA